MNISIDDAIDLHRCIEYIESSYDDAINIQECSYGIVNISFRLYESVIILNVCFNGHESLKAKEKLQEYFDE